MSFGIGITLPDSIIMNAQKKFFGVETAPATFTEYFVSDGIGGFEQANDFDTEQLFVKE